LSVNVYGLQCEGDGKLCNTMWDLILFLTCNKRGTDFRLLLMWLYFL